MAVVDKKKRKRKKAGSILLGVFLFFVALGVGFAILLYGTELAKSPPTIDSRAIMGSLPIPEEVKQTNDEEPSTLENIVIDYFNVFINSNPKYIDCSMDGDVRIENPESNKYGLIVKFQVITTGDVVYVSGVIPPGYYVETAPLSYELEAGKYPTEAICYAVDMETSDIVANASIRIFLDVLS